MSNDCFRRSSKEVTNNLLRLEYSIIILNVTSCFGLLSQWVHHNRSLRARERANFVFIRTKIKLHSHPAKTVRPSPDIFFFCILYYTTGTITKCVQYYDRSHGFGLFVFTETIDVGTSARRRVENANARAQHGVTAAG